MNRIRGLLSVILIMILLLFIVQVSCESSIWDCPECGKTGNTGNYCGICAYPAPWTDPTPSPLPSPEPSPAPTPDPMAIGNISSVTAGGTKDIVSLNWNPVPNADRYIVNYMAVGTITVLPYKTVYTPSVTISLPPGRYVIRISPANADKQGTAYVMEISVREKTATAAPNTTMFRVVTTDDAYIRTRPSTDSSTSKILAQVPSGQYYNAYERVSSESGGKDWYRILYKGLPAYVSTTKAEKTSGNSTAAASKVKKGDIVTFGHYPQTSSGKDNTPVEWLVLDVQDKKVLLLSQYALDCKKYNNTNNTQLTWEICTLRSWLNDAFLNRAFTVSEQANILTTKVDNSKSQGNSKYTTSGGKNTQDKVFLLSYAEAWKYLKTSKDRQCAPTPYAVMQEARTYSSDKVNGQAAVSWWLRSPGVGNNYQIIVKSDGSQSYYSSGIGTGVTVRPALWVDLNSDIF